jgi:hypothetical protein
MKKILLYICICLLVFTTATLGQQKQQSVEQRRPLMEQKADSAIANRTIKRMKELFPVSEKQEQALYQAGITINNNRRNVFKTYWKTEAFRGEMAKIDSTASLTYQSIIGEKNYQQFKEVLQADMIRKQIIMKQRADSQIKDTLTSKN